MTGVGAINWGGFLVIGGGSLNDWVRVLGIGDGCLVTGAGVSLIDWR